MGRSNNLRSSDVRQLLQIIAELGNLPHRNNDRLTHLLLRMRALFRARVATAAAAELMPDGTLRSFNFTSNGLAEAEVRGYSNMLLNTRGNQAPMAPYFSRLIAKQDKPHNIFDRRAMFDDRSWYGSTHTIEYCRLLGVDENLFAMALLPGTAIAAGFSLSRPWGEHRPFTGRERQMLGLLSQATIGLINPDERPNLPPRQQQVLDLLLEGHSAKEIASDLEISVHTVNEHLGVLYRRFKVSSRSELAARFVR